MKVVLLAPSKSSHTQKWALFYQKQGIDVTVITFKDHYSKENAKEVPTIVLEKYLPGKLSYITAVFGLRKLLQELMPDIFHAHFASSYGFVGALAGYHPFYVSVWGTDIFKFPKKNWVNRKMIEMTLATADVICSTSHAMAKETKQYTAKPIEVTPFGVDLSLFYPSGKQERNGYTIGIAKGLEDIYGFRDLFAAFALLNDTFAHLELVIIGDGSMRAEYEEICRSLQILDKTRFIGRIPNHEVPEYLRKMDLVVMPSYEDSFGVTAVEAMACGVPVIVSDVAGLTEVVVDQQTGVVVPKGNPEKLAEAIKQLLNNDALREKLGENGVQHVKNHYDWNENANRMIRFYQRSLSGKKEQK